MTNKKKTLCSGRAKRRLVFIGPISMALLILSSVYILHIYKDVPLSMLTRDVTAAAEVPAYIGIMSQAGLFLWASAATVCLFSFLVILRTGGERSIAYFMLASGVLNLLLGTDDALLLHEVVLPKAGVMEGIVFVFYAVMLMAYLVKYLLLVISTNFGLLCISLVFAVLSIATDLLLPMGMPGVPLVEDGANFIAMSFWLVYFWQTSVQAIEGKLGTEPGRADEAGSVFKTNVGSLLARIKPVVPRSGKH